MSVRPYTLITLALLLPLVVAACQGDTTAESESDVVELTFSYWGGPLEKESIENLIANFNEQHPGIRVRAQQIQGNYLEKMNTMASSNTLPDVGYFSEGSIPAWLENGRIRDLTELFESGEINEKLPYTIFQFEENGPIAGASVANEVYNIYYNKDLFDEANLPYPPDRAEDAWTWDEFVDVAKQLTKDRNGNHPGEPGFDPSNIETYGVNNFTGRYETYLYSNEGAIVSLDGKELLLDKPETIEVLQAIADLMYVHHVMPKPSDLSTIPNADAALLTKRIGMSLDGQWALQALGKARAEQGLNLGIGVLPKFKQPLTSNEGTPIVVFDTDNTEQNWDEAKQFVTFIMDPHNSLPLINEGLWMPNEVQWYEDPELIKKWTDTVVHPPEYKTAVIDWALNNVRQNPNYYWEDRAEAGQIINPSLDLLWNGKKSAEEVVHEDIMPKLKQTFGDKYE